MRLTAIKKQEPALYQALAEAYRTPERAYHNLAHVEFVLARAAEVDTYRHWAAVELAALFHDAIYTPGRSDNELESAQLCRDLVARHAPARQEALPEACALIMLTARHGSLTRDELTDDARHFLDADVAILGAEHARFAAYDAAIREEHAHVDDARYRAGRGAFLRHMLGLPRIFLSDTFRERYELRARENLSWALARLSDPTP